MKRPIHSISREMHDMRSKLTYHRPLVLSLACSVLFLQCMIISISTKYHRMSTNFKQTHDSAAESKPFQHYHHSGICTSIQLWWQWRWWVLQGTAVSSWSNTKAGHFGCTRWLERESWRRCTRRLGRGLWTFLQSGDQWQRAQAPRRRNLQQPCAGKHPRQP